MFFGITGNASIIIIILKNKLLRLQPINLFLLNLAISDLLHLCIGPFFYMFKRNAILTNFYLGEIGCLATPFFRGKVHILWEGHKILRNLHQLFDWQYIGQIIGEDFAKFCGLLRVYELYKSLKWPTDLMLPIACQKALPDCNELPIQYLSEII